MSKIIENSSKPKSFLLRFFLFLSFFILILAGGYFAVSKNLPVVTYSAESPKTDLENVKISEKSSGVFGELVKQESFTAKNESGKENKKITIVEDTKKAENIRPISITDEYIKSYLDNYIQLLFNNQILESPISREKRWASFSNGNNTQIPNTDMDGKSGRASTTGSNLVPVYIPTAIVPANPAANFLGASMFSATNISAENLSAKKLDVQDTVTAKSLNVSGTISGNFSGKINPSLAAGSLVFQDVDGLSEDNGNLFWDKQNKTLSVGTKNAHASAAFQVNSTTRGFLPPRMTESQRDAVNLPASGLVVFNTTSNKLNVFNGTNWQEFATGAVSNKLSDLTSATGDATLFNGSNNIVFNWQLAAAESALTIGESVASAGGNNDQYLLKVASLTGSSAMPFYVQNLGNARSVQIDDEVADTSPFVIDNKGNVGIGVSNPTAKFTVVTQEIDQPNIVVRRAPFQGVDMQQWQGENGAVALAVDEVGTLYAGRPVTANTAGNPTFISGGYSTGNANGGAIEFQTSNGGPAGASLNSGTTKMILTAAGNLGINNTNPTSILAFGGEASRTIKMERATSGLNGNSLTLLAGGSPSGSNRSGGNLILSSGISTGNQTSDILFQVPSAGASGSLDRSPATAMTLKGGGLLGIGTTTPSALLHARSSINTTQIGFFESTSTSVVQPNSNPAMGDGTAAGLKVFTADDDAPSVLIRNTASTLCVGQFTGCSAEVNPGGEGVLTIEASDSVNTDKYNLITAYNSTSRGQTSSVFRVRGDGNVYGEAAFNASGADYAEYFETLDKSIKAGEVVSGNLKDTPELRAKGIYVQKSARDYDSNILGVISSNPAFIGNNPGGRNENKDNFKLVGLMGKIEVKVSLENGEIKAGDFLTSSRLIPGYAMKASRSGYVLGQALEGLNKDEALKNIIENNDVLTGSLLAFVKPQYTVINTNFVLEDLSQTQLFGLSNGGEAVSNSANFIIDQKGSGKLLQLQNQGANRFVVDNSGNVAIQSDNRCEAIRRNEIFAPRGAGVEDLCADVLQVKNNDKILVKITAFGDVAFSGRVLVGQDTAGTAVIKRGDNRTSISFKVPYPFPPKVVLTIQGVPKFFYGIVSKDGLGFTIETSEPVAKDTYFDWLAFAQPDEVSSVSSLYVNEILVPQADSQSEIQSDETLGSAAEGKKEDPVVGSSNE